MHSGCGNFGWALSLHFLLYSLFFFLFTFKGKCKLRHYCCRSCQIEDFKTGHKTECAKLLWQHNEALAVTLHLQVLKEIISRPPDQSHAGIHASVMNLGFGMGSNGAVESALSTPAQINGFTGFTGWSAPYHFAYGPFPEGSTQFGYWRKNYAMAEFMNNLAASKFLKVSGGLFGQLNRGVMLELTSADIDALEKTGVMGDESSFVADARTKLASGLKVFYGCDC